MVRWGCRLIALGYRTKLFFVFVVHLLGVLFGVTTSVHPPKNPFPERCPWFCDPPLAHVVKEEQEKTLPQRL